MKFNNYTRIYNVYYVLLIVFNYIETRKKIFLNYFCIKVPKPTLLSLYEVQYFILFHNLLCHIIYFFIILILWCVNTRYNLFLSIYIFIAASLLSAMDPTADPCDDFYQYACGTWDKRHLIPEDKSSINTFEVLADRLQVILKG